MDQITAEIITIGDEILYGQITDTNSQWISASLDSIGIRVIRKTSVGDVKEDMLAAFEEAEKKANLILITGGLGPTNDDITKKCLAQYFESEIKLNPDALEILTNLFESRGYQLNDTNRLQAELPDKCEMVINNHGSAPGMWFERNGRVFISMPGVPYEMKAMMTEQVIPKVEAFFHIPHIRHKIIMTVGIGESWLSDKIQHWEADLPKHIKLAYLPSIHQVKLRLTAFGTNAAQLEEDLAIKTASLLPTIDKFVFGYDNISLEQAIGDLLVEKKLTIATAESCTGGYVAHRITTVPGSSRYFQGGIIPYQNELKTEHLQVQQQTLDSDGAVSEQTVIEMANAVRKKFHADIGLASSGIAGPGGGSAEKPVGTVWIAYADEQKTLTKKLQLGKLREINIQRSTVAILYLLWQTLTQKNGEE